MMLFIRLSATNLEMLTKHPFNVLVLAALFVSLLTGCMRAPAQDFGINTISDSEKDSLILSFVEDSLQQYLGNPVGYTVLTGDDVITIVVSKDGINKKSDMDPFKEPFEHMSMSIYKSIKPIEPDKEIVVLFMDPSLKQTLLASQNGSLS